MKAADQKGVGWVRAGVAVSARVLLGVALVYLGLVKLLGPVDFLKVLREYQVLASPIPLNAVAALLPWVEVVCGGLLILGIGVRGCAVVSAVMLVVFTGAVAVRAAGIQADTALPFCAIRFDCGCGNGAVNICRKLAENSVLILFAILAFNPAAGRCCLRRHLVALRGRRTPNLQTRVPSQRAG